jgi:hypothetical protein
MRDMPADLTTLKPAMPTTASGSASPALGSGMLPPDGYHFNDLRDSSWFFDGTSMRVWMDVHELLATAPTELGRDLAPTVSVQVDFYPLSILLSRGIMFGLESELVQRRDADFIFSRTSPRVSGLHSNSMYGSPRHGRGGRQGRTARTQLDQSRPCALHEHKADSNNAHVWLTIHIDPSLPATTSATPPLAIQPSCSSAFVQLLLPPSLLFARPGSPVTRRLGR